MVPRELFPYERSIREAGGVRFALVKRAGERFLHLSRAKPGFTVEPFPQGGYLGPLSLGNARALADVFPWLRPRRLPCQPSFGFGDRLGLATPGHVRACAGAQVFPILAQQSVRENARTERSFEEVLACAVFGAFQEGYDGGYGADADHLKSLDDALHAADLGYSFFTCDPSDHVVAVERLPLAKVARAFRSHPEADRWQEQFLSREYAIPGLGRIRFREEDLVCSAVKYGAAVGFAVEMYHALASRLPKGFDFEMSVDETDTPTSPMEHLFIALEFRRHDVALASLAPRFPGEMQKAVDWRGDLSAFRQELGAHVAIARECGPYRLSLHSGSDKPSLYPILADEAGGLWHVKTAGTSYLVALGVAAQFAPQLFREIVRFSVERFPEDRKSYHLSTDLDRVPDPETLPDERLPSLLAQDDSRQALHATYGSVLKSALGEELRRVLSDHEREHDEALDIHLGRHLELLGVRSHV